MKVPDTGKIISLVYIAGFIIALFVIYKILSAVGIIKTGKKKREQKEKAEALTELRTSDYFSPDYYKNKKFKSIGVNAADSYAVKLRKAVRGAGTDEESIYSTFGKLFNKCNISEVAERYYMKYKNDLQTDLLNDLTEKETLNLINIINALPNQ